MKVIDGNADAPTNPAAWQLPIRHQSLNGPGGHPEQRSSPLEIHQQRLIHTRQPFKVDRSETRMAKGFPALFLCIK